MKSLVIILLCVFSVNGLAQNISHWYLLAGTSLYAENVDHAVGEGLGTSLGFGAQISQNFGIELVLRSTPPIDPDDLIAFIGDDPDTDIVSSNIDRSASNWYTTAFATFSYPVQDRLALVGKLGWSTIRQRVYFNIKGGNTTETNTSRGPHIEFGFGFEMTWRTELVVTLSHVFSDDAEATGIHGAYKWKF